MDKKTKDAFLILLCIAIGIAGITNLYQSHKAGTEAIGAILLSPFVWIWELGFWRIACYACMLYFIFSYIKLCERVENTEKRIDEGLSKMDGILENIKDYLSKIESAVIKTKNMVDPNYKPKTKAEEAEAVKELIENIKNIVEQSEPNK